VASPHGIPKIMDENASFQLIQINLPIDFLGDIVIIVTKSFWGRLGDFVAAPNHKIHRMIGRFKELIFSESRKGQVCSATQVSRGGTHE
jgi:hypothetical protein